MNFELRDVREPQWSYDEGSGLRMFFLSVFTQMAASLVISGCAALVVQHSAPVQRALVAPDGMTILGWVVILAPLGLVLLLGSSARRMSGAAARSVLAVYALLVGLSLGAMLLGFADAGVIAAFVGAAAGFAAVAEVTSWLRRDLSGWGAFLTIALVGLIAALAVNLFLRSTGFDLVLAAFGVLLFAALSAYDVQRLKRLYAERPIEAGSALASLGALTLYLDLLNLFLSLLRLTGRRR